MSLEILHEPDDRLRVKSEEISLDDLRSDDTQTLIDEMLVEMVNANGVGLAAPQVGVNKRIIVVDEGKGPRVFVNPRISSKSFRKFDFEEGCLSVPGVWGFVHRHRSVTVKALDRDGKKIVVKGSGLLSVIFQHEIDHLDGVLFIDKVEKFTNPPRL